MNRLLCVCYALFVYASSAMAADKPNIVIMLPDNLGYGDIGAYGGGELRGAPTPNIDRLAADGIRFTQGLAGSSVCAPSRACLSHLAPVASSTAGCRPRRHQPGCRWTDGLCCPRA